MLGKKGVLGMTYSVDEVASGGGLAGIDVADNNEGNVNLGVGKKSRGKKGLDKGFARFTDDKWHDQSICSRLKLRTATLMHGIHKDRRLARVQAIGPGSNPLSSQVFADLGLKQTKRG